MKIIIQIHIAAVINNCNLALIPTSTFILNPVIWLKAASKYGATFSASPNFGFDYIFKRYKADRDYGLTLNKIRIILNAAEPISKPVCDKFFEEFTKYGLSETVITPAYGLAEATVGVSISEPDKKYEGLYLARDYLNIGNKIKTSENEEEGKYLYFFNCGKPFFNCEIRITDDSGNILTENHIGNLDLPVSFLFDYPIINQRSEKIFNSLLNNSTKIITEKRTATPKNNDKIAVIGYSYLLPTEIDDDDKFWEMLANGKNCIIEIPAEHWDYKKFSQHTEHKSSIARGAFIRNYTDFDSELFRITPREAGKMDPQQRLLLTTAYWTFENAGYDLNKLEGSSTGVFSGISSSEYQHNNLFSGNIEKINAYALTGSMSSIAAGRISYIFGLRGPCVALDTACSSSLVAIHNAVQSLKNQETSLALAGGVNMILSPETCIALSRADALSKTGYCRPFDNEADGYVRAEGCVLFVLKRLSDAIADKNYSLYNRCFSG